MTAHRLGDEPAAPGHSIGRGLNPTEVLVLRRCAGEIVQYPDDDEARHAHGFLAETKLIQPEMVDDQPTASITKFGRLVLSWYAGQRGRD